MHTITKFGRQYKEGGKCPACSSSTDKGGRLELKRRKNIFLKCAKCRYSVHSEKVVVAQMKKAHDRHDKQIGLRTNHL